MASAGVPRPRGGAPAPEARSAWMRLHSWQTRTCVQGVGAAGRGPPGRSGVVQEALRTSVRARVPARAGRVELAVAESHLSDRAQRQQGPTRAARAPAPAGTRGLAARHGVAQLLQHLLAHRHLGAARRSPRGTPRPPSPPPPPFCTSPLLPTPSSPPSSVPLADAGVFCTASPTAIPFSASSFLVFVPESAFSLSDPCLSTQYFLTSPTPPSCFCPHITARHIYLVPGTDLGTPSYSKE